MRALATAVVLAFAVPALAEEPTEIDPALAADKEAASRAGLPLPEADVAAEERARQEAAERRSHRWGIALDTGVPEGISAGVAFRPVPKLRLWAAPAWNYVGWGVQGGIAAVPWRFAVAPLFSAEAGYYFGTDVSFLARNSQGVPEELKPLLKDMGYWYAAAHAGIEVGSPRGLALSLRAGLSYIVLSSRGTATVTDASGVVVTFSDPRVRGIMPSVKLGIQFWF